MNLLQLVACGWAALGVAGDVEDFESRRSFNWHHWRGPLANGVAPHADPPVTWDETTHIKWKVAIPGSGNSTPIVWEDRIYLTTAVDTQRPADAAAASASEPAAREGDAPPRRGGGMFGVRQPTTVYQFLVLCLDRQSGRVVWQQVVTETLPHEGHHPDHGFASSSPTTDGKFLYVSFGSRGIYCLDLDGNVLWRRDLGQMRTRNSFGEGTSPVVHGDALIVNWDHEGDSFIVCLDAATGEDRWRVARDELTTWNTPLIVEHEGVTQVVVNATNRTRSYDLATGAILWECGGQASNPIASPVTDGGIVYCMTGHRGFALKAIPLAARGDITDTNAVVWQRDRGTPYVPSPLVHDGLLYFTRSNNGILTCVRAATGEEVFADQRLDGIPNIYASIAYAAGKLYLTGRQGTTVVLKFGPTVDVLATNKLDEGIDASPVLVGAELFLRGRQHLYCIAEE